MSRRDKAPRHQYRGSDFHLLKIKQRPNLSPNISDIKHCSIKSQDIKITAQIPVQPLIAKLLVAFGKTFCDSCYTLFELLKTLSPLPSADPICANKTPGPCRRACRR
jgi:hypothetical protein